MEIVKHNLQIKKKNQCSKRGIKMRLTSVACYKLVNQSIYQF